MGFTLRALELCFHYDGLIRIWKLIGNGNVNRRYEVNNEFVCVDSAVSLGFFDDIIIPPESLQQPAKLYPESWLLPTH